MEDSDARADDEQHRRIVLRNPKITHVKTGQPITPVGDVLMASNIDSDYLTLCLATVYSGHFYQDFEGADSCLVIHNPDNFFDRMYKAIDSVLPEAWGAVDGPVSYGSHSRLGAPFTKSEKFAFQFEWRFACFPIPSLNKCEATIVTLGSIEDIAEVISAPESAKQLISRSNGHCGVA
jgi:hypothetical protein